MDAASIFCLSAGDSDGNHPNVIIIFKYWVIAGCYYVIEFFVAGKSGQICFFQSWLYMLSPFQGCIKDYTQDIHAWRCGDHFVSDFMILWNRQSSVYSTFTLRPESFIHFMIVARENSILVFSSSIVFAHLIMKLSSANFTSFSKSKSGDTKMAVI